MGCWPFMHTVRVSASSKVHEHARGQFNSRPFTKAGVTFLIPLCGGWEKPLKSLYVEVGRMPLTSLYVEVGVATLNSLYVQVRRIPVIVYSLTQEY